MWGAEREEERRGSRVKGNVVVCVGRRWGRRGVGDVRGGDSGGGDRVKPMCDTGRVLQCPIWGWKGVLTVALWQ